MREIKFRGKDIDGGQWVFGNYVRYTEDDGEEIHCIVSQERCKVSDELVYTQIVHESVGQFIGLKDKNGRDIYEGDIIRKTETTYRMTDIGVVKYCNDEAKFVLHVTDKYSAYDFSFVKDFQSQDGHATVPCHNEYEVVGNVFDNPELLKFKI